MIAHRPLHPAHSLIFALLFAACSSNEGQTTANGPDFPAGVVPNGIIMRCGPEQFVCIPQEAFCAPLYINAFCAATFGGSPNDYGEGFQTSAKDYPAEGLTSDLCVTSHDFEADYMESPAITNLVNFQDEPIPGYCTHYSYCTAVKQVHAVYPEFPFNPLCNNAPDGNPNEPAPWKCVGSVDLACGIMTSTVDGVSEDKTVCPAPKSANPQWHACVLATGEQDANEKCTQHCEAASGALAFKAAQSSELVYTEPLKCGVYESLEMVWVEDNSEECFNRGVLPVPEWPLPFVYTVSLVTTSGSSAAAAGLAGFMDVVVDSCDSKTCAITISDISLTNWDVAGVLHDASGASHDYAISGLSVQLMSPSSGVLDKVRNTVTFPADVLDTQVRLDSVTLDGLPLPLADARVVVDQVVGFVRADALTLNITYNTPEANLTISLTTATGLTKKTKKPKNPK